MTTLNTPSDHKKFVEDCERFQKQCERDFRFREHLLNALFFGSIAGGFLLLVLAAVAGLGVEMYLKIKNNGIRNVHAVEVVK